VGDAHRRIGGVDVLAARAGSAVNVDLEVFVLDLHIDLVGSGSTATVAAEVWMRPPLSVTGTRCTRWTPLSNFSLANTFGAGDVGDRLP
jgi:hypothetical protein